MSIRELLGLGKSTSRLTEPAASDRESETVRKIARALELLEPERAKHIAGFAFILSRVANSDSKISEQETRQMERIVMVWGHLPEEQAVLVVQIAKHQNILFGGTDNYVITREFSRTATRDQKVELLHCLFAVSAADESISSVEESVVSQIARELGISHQQHVEIRRAYRDKRAVMKDLPR